MRAWLRWLLVSDKTLILDKLFLRPSYLDITCLYKPVWPRFCASLARPLERGEPCRGSSLGGTILTNDGVESDITTEANGATERVTDLWGDGNKGSRNAGGKCASTIYRRIVKGPWQGSDSSLESGPPRSSRAQPLA